MNIVVTGDRAKIAKLRELLESEYTLMQKQLSPDRRGFGGYFFTASLLRKRGIKT